jgi:hypothetical protein
VNLVKTLFSAQIGLMPGGEAATFRRYLESLPSELLESVTEDYVWLSGLTFDRERDVEFRLRRECCREECVRRGQPDLYWIAEEVVSPWAA